MESIKFISQKELAEALNVSRFTIMNWKPPCYKAPNGSPLYVLEEVIEWLRANGNKTVSDGIRGNPEDSK